MAKTIDTLDSDEVIRFEWRARNSAGKVERGVLRAARAADVTRELIGTGMVPLSVKEVTGFNMTADFEIRKTAKPRDLAIATRNLATMLDAGLNYIEAIDVVRGDCADPVLAKALGEVRHQVLSGVSLPEAFASQDRVFPPTMINLLTAGDASGRLKDGMNQVADALDSADELRSKIRKAMVFPAILAVMSGGVFAFMMLWLIPKFAAAFKDLGGPDAKLPTLTQWTINLSHILTWALPLAIVLTVPAVLAYRKYKNLDRVREIVDPLKLKIPVFGNLMHKMALERFTSDLASLLGAGVERLEALSIAARTCGNIRMERAVLAAREAQRQGRPLVEPLKAEPLFPSALIQMVEAGERSGKTPYMLEKAAAMYRRQVNEITDNLTEAVQPIFLIVIGGMVGVLVLSIYMPYLKMGDVISGGGG